MPSAATRFGTKRAWGKDMLTKTRFKLAIASALSLCAACFGDPVNGAYTLQSAKAPSP